MAKIYCYTLSRPHLLINSLALSSSLCAKNSNRSYQLSSGTVFKLAHSAIGKQGGANQLLPTHYNIFLREQYPHYSTPTNSAHNAAQPIWCYSITKLQ